MNVIIVSDLSASIEPESRASMFKAIESVVGILRRADTLTIIPVTDDAEIDSPGHVLRFQLPTEREVYDEDLRRVNRAAQKALEEISGQAMKEPSAHTDLLGALRVAFEELAELPPGRKGVVVVLSDFIQDDNQFDFKRERNLSHPAEAKALAMRLAARSTRLMQNTPVFLGYLRSRDLGRLNRPRREAIREFWLAFLAGLGAKPQCATDGPGLLPWFLNKERAHEAP
jgi:hypothetical protein